MRDSVDIAHCCGLMMVIVGIYLTFMSCGSDGCLDLDQGKLTTGAHWEMNSRTVTTFSVSLLDQSGNAVSVSWSDEDGDLIYEPTDTSYGDIQVTHEVYGTPSADTTESTPYQKIALEYCDSVDCYTLDWLYDSSDDGDITCTSVDSTNRQCVYHLEADQTLESPSDGSTQTLQITVDVEQEEEYVPENESGCVWLAENDVVNKNVRTRS